MVIMSIDVSLLLDSQLSPEDVPAALRAVAADPQLRDRYTVYGLVGDAMRGLSVPDDGFSVRIFDRLRREGVRIEPGFDPLAGDR
jgi:negative regulator of sigma E activity